MPGNCFPRALCYLVAFSNALTWYLGSFIDMSGGRVWGIAWHWLSSQLFFEMGTETGLCTQSCGEHLRCKLCTGPAMAALWFLRCPRDFESSPEFLKDSVFSPLSPDILGKCRGESLPHSVRLCRRWHSKSFQGEFVVFQYQEK